MPTSIFSSRSSATARGNVSTILLSSYKSSDRNPDLLESLLRQMPGHIGKKALQLYKATTCLYKHIFRFSLQRLGTRARFSRDLQWLAELNQVVESKRKVLDRDALKLINTIEGLVDELSQDWLEQGNEWKHKIWNSPPNRFSDYRYHHDHYHLNLFHNMYTSIVLGYPQGMSDVYNLLDANGREKALRKARHSANKYPHESEKLRKEIQQYPDLVNALSYPIPEWAFLKALVMRFAEKHIFKEGFYGILEPQTATIDLIEGAMLLGSRPRKTLREVKKWTCFAYRGLMFHPEFLPTRERKLMELTRALESTLKVAFPGNIPDGGDTESFKLWVEYSIDVLEQIRAQEVFRYSFEWTDFSPTIYQGANVSMGELHDQLRGFETCDLTKIGALVKWIHGRRLHTKPPDEFRNDPIRILLVQTPAVFVQDLRDGDDAEFKMTSGPEMIIASGTAAEVRATKQIMGWSVIGRFLAGLSR